VDALGIINRAGALPPALCMPVREVEEVGEVLSELCAMAVGW